MHSTLALHNSGMPYFLGRGSGCVMLFAVLGWEVFYESTRLARMPAAAASSQRKPLIGVLSRFFGGRPSVLAHGHSAAHHLVQFQLVPLVGSLPSNRGHSGYWHIGLLEIVANGGVGSFCASMMESGGTWLLTAHLSR